MSWGVLGLSTEHSVPSACVFHHKERDSSTQDQEAQSKPQRILEREGINCNKVFNSSWQVLCGYPILSY